MVDSFEAMYSKFTKSSAKTLILLVNEVDHIIRKIDNGIIWSSAKLRVQVNDKSSWNDWLDYIDKYCSNTIVLFTSNTLYENISQDTSYLRHGRTHLRFRLNKNSLEYLK